MPVSYTHLVVDDAAVDFRLYGYEDGEKTLISSEPALNLRQFYAGANNGRRKQTFQQRL